MKLILLTIFKNLGAMLVSRPMIFWGLRSYTEFTDNMLDDNGLNLLEGALDNDVEKVKAAAEAILAELKKDK